jgi:hypothetical protein
MSRSRRLSALFQTLVGASAIGGCGKTSPVDVVDAAPVDAALDGDLGPFPDTVCDANGKYVPLDGITFAQPMEYFELRHEQPTNLWPDAGPTDGGLPVATVEAHLGTPCATASNPAQCLTTLADLRTSKGFTGVDPYQRDPTYLYAVYTKGDAVVAVTDLTQLAALLAPIENAKDAALLTYAIRHVPTCPVRRTAAGFELRTEFLWSCGTFWSAPFVDEVTTDGAVRTIWRGMTGVCGRRTDGLVDGSARSQGPLADYLAEMVRLEAGSILAFARLELELEHHGAPADLVRRAAAFVSDEASHAHMVSAQAARFGARVAAPPVLRCGDARTLIEIAIENAIEGCVRETFGALLATYQAAHARDPELAEMFRRIADDETRHAALAWDIAAWLDERLSNAERDAVRRALQRTVGDLHDELGVAGPARERTGLPDVVEARRLWAGVTPIWNAAPPCA